jgi:hypothetical protein
MRLVMPGLVPGINVFGELVTATRLFRSLRQTDARRLARLVASFKHDTHNAGVDNDGFAEFRLNPSNLPAGLGDLGA